MLNLVVSWLLLFAFVARADIDPKKVHIVDYRPKTGNGGAAMIFRGNTPVSDAGTTLNYTAWYDAMAANAAAQLSIQLAPPSQLYIIDISLEDPYLDYQFDEEVAFWNNTANTAKGEFVNWQLYGSMNYPPDFNVTLRDEMALNASLWDIDHLPQRVLAIRELMLAGPPVGYSQLAVFFHCTHGQDRTGEFANAYRLAWHSSIEDGSRLSKAIEGRRVAHRRQLDNVVREDLARKNPLIGDMLGSIGSNHAGGSALNDHRSLRNRNDNSARTNSGIMPPPNPRAHRVARNFHDSNERKNSKNVLPGTHHVGGSNAARSSVVNGGSRSGRQQDDLTTMGAIYSLGCQEGLRCPMYTFTANAGWFCLWSNALNGTSYGDCSTAYSCIPLLFCEATNV